jgi:LCP family protein required for cell wall assembly
MPNIKEFFRLNYKKILLVFGLVVLFLVSSVGTYFFLTFKKVVVKKPEEERSISLSKLQRTRQESGFFDSYSLLLIGYGGAGHEGGTLADSLIVASMDLENKKAFLISIPRDLWVQIPIRSDAKQYHKINASYAIGLDDTKYPLKESQFKGEAGGGEMAKHVVTEVVGMPIDYFASVDFDGFINGIDTLEGVEVDVPVAFDDDFYPIKGKENETCGKSASEIGELHQQYSDTELHHQFKCRYENIHFDEGITTMDGETALKFVRSRASAQHGGDFARSQRQQAVLVGIKNKLVSIEAVKNVAEIFGQFAEMTRTDLDLQTTINLVEIFGSPEEYEIVVINIDDKFLNSNQSADGQFILIPKEGDGIFTGIHNYISEEMSK